MTSTDAGHVWTIILAGGEGTRLQRLTRALHGENRPKQFAFILGDRSLLQTTVERALRWSPPERIVVVVAAERAELAREQLANYRAVQILAQPRSCGTAAGILLPVVQVLAQDASAQLVVLPSDHYVKDELPFESSVRAALDAAVDGITLVGAIPNQAETQYGWIVPQRKHARGSSGVARFLEKPAAAVAGRLLRRGALWNTFVMAGAAQEFWRLSREHLPAQTALFDAYQEVAMSPHSARVLEQIYVDMPEADFSRQLLQRASGLTVVPLRECGWSDWGTPERVLESLRHDRAFHVLTQCLALTGGGA